MTTSSSPITFRYAVCAEDVKIVTRLVRATGFFNASEVSIAAELVQERLDKGLASGYEFVFACENSGSSEEPDEQILGYSCYGEIPCTTGSYDIYWIVVDPAQQRRGIGRCLMAETERKALILGGRRLYIDTSGKPQYLPTRQFYERCGYTIAAELPDFYALDDPKIIYFKKAIG